MSSSLTIINLLPENLRSIADFLSLSDVVRLRQTCHGLCRTLSLSVLRPPAKLFGAGTTSYLGATTGRDVIKPGLKLPVWFPQQTHSIVIQGRWRDQGWGNRKGRVMVVASPQEDATVFEEGRVVVCSEIAPHRNKSLQLSFRVQPNEYYRLWYHCGSGGGHALHLTGWTMVTVLMDTQDKILSKVFQQLNQAVSIVPEFIGTAKGSTAANEFGLDMIATAAQSLLQQQHSSENDSDPNLCDYLSSNGFDLDSRSLMALCDLCNRSMSLG